MEIENGGSLDISIAIKCYELILKLIDFLNKEKYTASEFPFQTAFQHRPLINSIQLVYIVHSKKLIGPEQIY